MKITLNGTKVRAFKGVDKNNRPYQFIVVGGHTEGGKTARAVFNNKFLYEVIAKAATSILDNVEVAADRVREHSFTGRDGHPVSIVETVDPTPTELVKTQFPATLPWPDWETLMEVAGASTDAPAPAEDSEAEF